MTFSGFNFTTKSTTNTKTVKKKIARWRWHTSAVGTSVPKTSPLSTASESRVVYSMGRPPIQCSTQTTDGPVFAEREWVSSAECLHSLPIQNMSQQGVGACVIQQFLAVYNVPLKSPSLNKGLHTNSPFRCPPPPQNAYVQLGYLDVTVQEKLRSGWPRPFVKVEGCCD
jgi:hypothetical protein